MSHTVREKSRLLARCGAFRDRSKQLNAPMRRRPVAPACCNSRSRRPQAIHALTMASKSLVSHRRAFAIPSVIGRPRFTGNPKVNPARNSCTGRPSTTA
jgi:hypothetical protein